MLRRQFRLALREQISRRERRDGKIATLLLFLSFITVCGTIILV